MEIAAWLCELGLGHYEPNFRDSEIDLEILPELTDADLRELGLPLGPRKKILKVIAALPQASPYGACKVEHLSIVRSQAERRHLTVLFCDLADSTALSTRLDPEDLGEILRTYQSRCSKVVARWNGHVARILGDGILAYFGYPQAGEDDAERAVRAGLELAQTVSDLKASDGTGLAVRVGIATGLVMVGDLVEDAAVPERVVAGETPNLAARLQSIAGPGQVVLAKATRDLIGNLFELGELGVQSLKGIATPVLAFTVLGEHANESRFESQHVGSLLTMVGRDQELAVLMERWRRAKAGEGQLVLLTGDAGIGKSRIVRALGDAVAAEEHIRITYQCSPYHKGSALYPTIQQLTRAARFTPDESNDAKLDKLEALLRRAVDEINEAAPLIAALLGLDAEGRYGKLGLSPQQKRARTLVALTDQLLGLARQQPVLFILEDAQWLDPTTLHSLQRSFDAIADQPVLMLVTSRPDGEPEISERPNVTRLALKRLARDQIIELIATLTRGKRLPKALLEEIVAKTDGVPLFIEELTKAVLGSGLLHETRDAYLLDQSLGTLAIPTSLHDSLMARLDRLQPVKEIAQAAACIGREFSYAQLLAVATFSEDELKDALDRLLAAELIFQRRSRPEVAYLFKHALVRDAAYESLLKSRRRELHARIGHILERQFLELAKEEPELLAHHFGAAGLPEKAVTYWEKAGQLASSRSAYEEALAHFDKGIQTLECLLAGAARMQHELRLRAGYAGVLAAARGYVCHETKEAYVRLRGLCQALDDPPEAFHVLRGMFNFHMIGAEYSTAYQIAVDCLNLAKKKDEWQPLSLAHRLVGHTLFRMGRLKQARSHLQQAFDLYDDHQDRQDRLIYGVDLKVGSLMFLSQALCLLGYPDQAVAAVRDNFIHANQLDDAFNRALAMNFGCYVWELRRDYRIGLTQAIEMRSLAVDHGLSYLATEATGHQLRAKVGLGERNENTVSALTEHLEIMRSTGALQWFSDNLMALALSLAALKKWDQAFVAIDEALTHAEKSDERHCEAELKRTKGALLLATRKSDGASDAEAYLIQSLDIARSQGAKFWELRSATSLARLWAKQGDQQRAHDILAPVYNWFSEGFDTQDLQNARVLLEELGTAPVRSHSGRPRAVSSAS